MKMQKKLTIQDISNQMGVLTTTIMRVLNGKPKASDDLRTRIIQTANNLGYYPNKLAQAYPVPASTPTCAFMPNSLHSLSWFGVSRDLLPSLCFLSTWGR